MMFRVGYASCDPFLSFAFLCGSFALFAVSALSLI